jgi:acyl-CoA synthetase (AMP-forming)/AMP-acid ligase II
VSDFINVAGRKLNPAAVERVLLDFSEIREAAVFGVPSAGRGEAVVAWVAASGTPDVDAILGHCRQHLAAWQVPREIRVVAAIPLNSRGKISRRELARLHAGA